MCVRRWINIYDQYGRLFFRSDIYRGRLFLGAKQKGLTIVHFINKLIVACKEAVRVPFQKILVISKLDSYFLFKLIGYFRWFTPIVHSMLRLRIHFRLVYIIANKYVTPPSCILYRYIMFGRGICEKYQSRDEKFPQPNGEGNLVWVFFGNTTP
jgi:hypothetical protein